MADPSHFKSGLIGLYLRNFAANITGNLTIVLLNLFTPLEVFKDWQSFLRQGGWVLLAVALPLIFLTAVISFFIVDDYSRRKLVPLLFSEGRLAATVFWPAVHRKMM